MKNLYIIYGCNKYWSRFLDSKSTWMNGMGSNEDYIILGETSIPELKMLGFPSDNGQYLNLGIRTLMFLDEYDEYLKEWDWITFVDDDAYLFRNRLIKKIKKLDQGNRGIVVGKSVGHRRFIMNGLPIKFTLMHGGATISLNRIATCKMIDYLKKNKNWLYDNSSTNKSFRSFGDVCVSFLVRKSLSKIINCPFEMSFLNYKTERLKGSDLYKIISTHNVNNEDKKKLYELDLMSRKYRLI